jgi:hypothetical protein
MTVSVLVATSGRPTLEAALESITCQTRPGDQVLVIGATLDISTRAAKYGCDFMQAPPGKDWGASERQFAAPYATGEYLTFLDDDDVWLPGARDAMESAMLAHPGQPTIFKMRISWTGGDLWQVPELRMGNVGTPMFFLPNQKDKLGMWGRRYGGDFDFIASCRWPRESYVFDPHVVALIRPQ